MTDNKSLMDTIVLLKDFKNGHHESLGILYERYREKCLLGIRMRMGKYLKGKFETADILQSAIIESLSQVDKFEYKSEGAFVHWLSKIAENKVKDKVKFIKAQKRDVSKEVGNTGLQDILMGHSLSPDLILEQKEEMELLEKALMELDEDDRELVIKVKIEGLTYKEIADMDPCPSKNISKLTDAIRKRTTRAVAKLSRIMAK